MVLILFTLEIEFDSSVLGLHDEILIFECLHLALSNVPW